jgi:hypothetical protein
MFPSPVKIFFLIFCEFIFFNTEYVKAQTITYSSENIFIENPDKLQFVGSIDGNYHLVIFFSNEQPSIFIFNNELQYRGKINMPFKYPDKADVRIISFDKFYYVLIYSRYNSKYFLWKVDGNGNVNDMSSAFHYLLTSQFESARPKFDLVVNQNRLYMIFHNYLPDIEKNETTILQIDSALNVVYTNKVTYKLRLGDGQVQQEMLVGGKELIILKTSHQSTSLVLWKVNLTTGYTINNTFSSSGYLYSQSNFSYNITDSSFTVYSLLKEPRAASSVKRYVFISRLNNLLIEQKPFAVLKSQFGKNTDVNFLQVDGFQWIRLRAERESLYSDGYYSNPYENNRLYQDLTNPNYYNPNVDNNNRMLQRFNSVRYFSVPDNSKSGIRFSLLDKNLSTIKSDTLFDNNKNSFTIQADKIASFSANNKSYMLIGQRFFKKSNGILMINESEGALVYTDVRVNDRNDYLLSQSKIITRGLIIPYIHKREAGLVKITIE